MATTAEAYGFGARAPYATPRASDYEMKERVRLSGLFPRVRNEPLSEQLQVLLKEFEQNAALTGILERRRRLEERLQFELRGTEGMDALNRNLAPPFRAGLAGAALSADVADRLARSRVAGQLAARVTANRAAQAAPAAPAAPGGPGVSSTGGSSGSGAGVGLFGEPPVPTLQQAAEALPGGVMPDEYTVAAPGRSRSRPPRSRPPKPASSRPASASGTSGRSVSSGR